ncbi:hypothetical protein SUGI_1125600 [Cryptomeria japonica]|nr:hypothetical protein SUGI_1125600 [Cryptomeria japonica]
MDNCTVEAQAQLNSSEFCISSFDGTRGYKISEEESSSFYRTKGYKGTSFYSPIVQKGTRLLGIGLDVYMQ